MLTKDRTVIQEGEILGIVLTINREAKDRAVSGGLRGLSNHYLLRFRKLIQTSLSAVVRPVIRLLYRRTTLPGMLQPKYQLKTFLFQDSQCQVARLFWGDRIIGQCDYSSGNWQIDHRYRCLIDIKTLPSIDSLKAKEDLTLGGSGEADQ